VSSLETVPGVASAISRKISGELVFTVGRAGRAADVIRACTPSGIAVLGVEVFPGLNVSTYDQRLEDPPDERCWPDYVRTNNALAEDFLRKNSVPTTYECILTTAPWQEFREIKRQAKHL
jgi:hypothetical protein